MFFIPLGGVVPTASVSVISDPLHPFNHPQDGPRARAFTPDSMEPDEMKHFPEYCKCVVCSWCTRVSV